MSISTDPARREALINLYGTDDEAEIARAFDGKIPYDEGRMAILNATPLGSTATDTPSPYFKMWQENLQPPLTPRKGDNTIRGTAMKSAVAHAVERLERGLR